MAGDIDAIKVVASGVSITTGAASANAAIPNNSSGKPPNYIRISVTANCFIKIGVGVGTAATSTDLLMIPADHCILKVNGETYIAAIQQASAGVCNVVPLEDL